MPHDDDDHESTNGVALQLVELPAENVVQKRHPLRRLDVPRGDSQSSATVKLVDGVAAVIDRVNHMDHDLVEHGAQTIDGFAKLDKRVEQRISALTTGIKLEFADLKRRLFGSDGEIAVRARTESGHALEEVTDGIEEVKDAIEEIKTNPFLDRATGRPLTQSDLDLRDARKRAREAETQLKALQKRKDKWGNRTWTIAAPIILAVLFAIARAVEAGIRGHW